MATNNIGVGSNQTADGLSGNDSIFGTGAPSLNDMIYGHMGNDTINGLAGGTEIDLSTMYGGQGNNSILVNNFDRVYGNLGNDSLSLGSGSNSTLYGGQGDDVLRSAGNDSVGSISTASAFVSVGNASLTGGNSNVYYGNLGNDSFFVYDNNSTAFGGQGDDRIYTQGSSNLVHGGLGNDNIYDFGFAAGLGNATLFGDGGNDVVGGDFNDMLYGNQGNDTLYSESNSSLFGGQGDDSLNVFGNGGITNDLVYGNLGNDILIDHSTAATTVGAQLFGGQGNDTILSLASNADIMNGGLGNDLFVDSYRTATPTGGHTTTVSDFVTGTDQVSFGSGAGLNNGTNTPAPSGNGTNFVASQNNQITNEADAAKYAATVEASQPNAANIAYVFVAGATDGYLFYDGTGAGTGSPTRTSVTTARSPSPVITRSPASAPTTSQAAQQTREPLSPA